MSVRLSKSAKKGTDKADLRVLMASHAHPRLSRGGSEIAAFHLYEALSNNLASECWFLGCSQDDSAARAGVPITQPFQEREFVYSIGEFDWFKFANRDSRFPKAFTELLKELQPNVVHFHHFLNFGVEAFQLCREALPQARIVLTVHEYLLLCHHYGQMVTKGLQLLCNESAPRSCHSCFPEIAASDFFLRELYCQRFLSYVDHFVAPSQFLADRLVKWGLPAKKISVIENLLPDAAISDISTTLPRTNLRAGFFGQISRLKGINVLLDAARLLERDGDSAISIDIYGEYRGQPPEFQAEFLERLAGAGLNVTYHGPYQSTDVTQLMRQVDAIIVPSIWWENSPLVIQEALRARRPIICSNIGGMAEKVRQGMDGWHFPVGNAVSLASLLRQVAADRSHLEGIQRTMGRTSLAESVAHAHERIYRGLGGQAEA